MVKSKSSKNWLKEHFDDAYVKQAGSDGYRSRASYKLLGLQEKDKLFKPGMTVVDLGAAPGGWSQVAMTLVGNKGRVIASDILPMDSIAGVSFIAGDFTKEEVLEDILNTLGPQKADLVLSDMAPNMSGMAEIDQPRSIYLAELALDLAQKVLKPNANLVVKVFHGEGFDGLVKSIRGCFSKVVSRKPIASRARSREVYLLAKGFKSTLCNIK